MGWDRLKAYVYPSEIYTQPPQPVSRRDLKAARDVERARLSDHEREVS